MAEKRSVASVAASGYRPSMTTTPQEPTEEPEVVPSGDPEPIPTPDPESDPIGDPDTEDSTGVEGDTP